MQKLNLQTPERSISIDLTTSELTVIVNNQEGSAAMVVDNGLEWSETLLGGESVSYAKAEKAVKKLGDGWRLPTRQELESILDLSRHDPAIDTDKFPDTESKWYWTSTPCAWREDAVWCVDFSAGFVNSLLRGSYGCVRAVRSGQ